MGFELSGRGPMVGILRPTHHLAQRTIRFQRVGQSKCESLVGLGGGDRQPDSSIGVWLLGQGPRLPFDGEQSLGEYPVALASLNRSGTHLQAAYDQQHFPGFVHYVEIGGDVRRGARGYSGDTVTSVAGRTVAAE